MRGAGTRSEVGVLSGRPCHSRKSWDLSWRQRDGGPAGARRGRGVSMREGGPRGLGRERRRKERDETWNDRPRRGGSSAPARRVDEVAE